MAEAGRPYFHDGDGFRHRIDAASTPELLRQLSTEVKLLLREEMEVARRDFKEAGREAARGGIATGIGLYLAALGGAALAFCLIAALTAAGLPWWGSALIVGAVLALIGGAVAAAGAKRFKKVKPHRTMSHLKEDEQWLMSTLRRLPATRRESTSG